MWLKCKMVCVEGFACLMEGLSRFYLGKWGAKDSVRVGEGFRSEYQKIFLPFFFFLVLTTEENSSRAQNGGKIAKDKLAIHEFTD